MRFLLALALASNLAFAAGRLGIAAGNTPAGFELKGYVEQVLFSVLGVESTAGVQFSTVDGYGPELSTAFSGDKWSFRVVGFYNLKSGLELWAYFNLAW